MASQQFEDAFKNGPSRFVSQRPKFIDNNGYNNYTEQYRISGNVNDRRYCGRGSPYNESHINDRYPQSQTRQPYHHQQIRRIVVPSNSQQTFNEICDRKRPRTEYYYRGNSEYQQQQPISQIHRNYPIKRPCIDGRINPPTTSINQNNKLPVVLRPITRITKPQYPPHKVIQRFVDRHPNTIIMRAPNVPYNGNLNLQQSVVKPRNLKEDGYVNKLKLIRKSCRNMIFTNAAMVDEISRVNFAIQTVTEEVQMLAKKVQHLERNKLRRYQQLLKREALSECKERNDNDKLIPSHEIDVYYDNKLDRSINDKEEISDIETMNSTNQEDQQQSDIDYGHFENHEDKSNDIFSNYDIDNDLLLNNDQLSVDNEYYQNPFEQYTNEHSILL